MSGSLAALAAAQSTEELSRLLEEHPTLAHPDTVTALYDQVTTLLRADLSQASSAAQASLWLSKQIQHSPSIALSLRALGNVQLLAGATRAALANYSEALNLFETDQAVDQIAQTYSNMVSAYLRLGDYQQAQRMALTARELFQELDDALGLARVENNLGSLLFRQENYTQARVHWQNALSTFRHLDYSHDVAIALRNLAVCEISLNNFHQALEIYNEVSTYCREHDLKLLLHEVEYNIAYLYFLRGDHEQALQGYRSARQRSLSFGDLYHAALCDLDESELYLELNLLPDSIALAERASVAFRDLDKSYETAKALAFTAIATTRLGDHHQALALLRESHAEFSAQGHMAWASLTLLYEALVYYREGRRFEARRSATEALESFGKIGNPGKAALCHLLLARLHLQEGNPELALEAAQAAFRLLSPRDLPQIIFHAHLLSAEISEYQDDLASARTSYYAAEELLRGLRTQLSATDLHIPFSPSRLNLYDRLLQIEYTLSDPDDLAQTAFSLIERSKARSLSDLFGPKASTIPPNHPARSSLVEQVRGLREELRWYYKRIEKSEMMAERPASENTLLTSIQEMEEKIVSSLAELSKEDLEFGSLHQAFALDLGQIQGLLDEDEAVLEYFVGEDVVFLLLISANTCSCQPIAVASEISELHRLLEFQLSRAGGPSFGAAKRERSGTSTIRYLQRLYRELIHPIRDRLEAKRRLRIVPHSFLAYLPFHAFVKGNRLLEDEYTLSYSPSVLSLYFSKRRKPAERQRSALVLGSHNSAASLNRLCGKGWILRVLSDRGSRSDWESSLKESWQLVGIGLNASFRFDNPALSTISILGSPMTLLDLFQLRVKAKTLVATGCGPRPARTGTGDEVLCLTRGLLYSGPRAAVMPLWRTRTEPESAVLEELYSGLLADVPAADAVRAARKACRREYPHPADWAAWAVYGI